MEDIMGYTMLIWMVGSIAGYYISYSKGEKIFDEQMGLYKEGVFLDLKDISELYKTILDIHCPYVKNAWIGDGGNIFIEGKKNRHEFYLENGIVKMKYPYTTANLHIFGIARSLKQMSIHKDIAAMVEANKIMDAIIDRKQPDMRSKKGEYEKAFVGAKILYATIALFICGAIIILAGAMYMSD